jgi:phospholipid/cholesterol/gamma-HCH transport system ATP-binding protein
MDAEVVLEADEVVKTFDGRRVLDGVSLQVRRGETLVIMGGSGCGKSTLLRTLVGAYRPEAGAVRIFGRDLATLDDAAMNETRKRFGILFQNGALYTSMTVGENVALPMREHTDLSAEVIEIMVKMKLELVGLRDFEDLKPAQISGGMAKRVGLARAIALDPEILFYDEPSAGLDPVMTAVIDRLIMDLHDKLKVTSVVVTHEMASAFRVADRMVMLHNGRVVAEGTPETFRDADDPLVRQFITGAPDGPIPLRRSDKDYLEDLLA